MTHYCIQCRQDVSTQPFLNIEQLTQHPFTIMRCSQCGLGWTVVPSDFDVSPYYPEEYYGSKNKRFQPVVEWLISFFRRARAGMILRQMKPGRILDIGCGRGLMLKELKEHGWECFGTEYSAKAAAATSEFLGIPIQVTTDIRTCTYPDHSFDVVTLWHVFEHIPNPIEILSEIRRILKPGGLVIIEVPNLSSWQFKIIGQTWIHLDAPRHFFHYSRKSLKSLIETHGFQVDSIHTLSLEFGPFGMLQSLLNLCSGRPNFIYFLMKNKEEKLSHLKTGASPWKLALLFIVFSPLILLSVILEMIAVAFGRGGVLQVLARKP